MARRCEAEECCEKAWKLLENYAIEEGKPEGPAHQRDRLEWAEMCDTAKATVDGGNGKRTYDELESRESSIAHKFNL